jgi:hypothetical protein
LISVFAIVIALAKSIKRLVYEIILLIDKIYIFRVINKIFSKRWKAKKNRIYQGDILIIEDIYDILA